MKVFNFGSINIDHVYSVDHFVQPGQTISSENYHQFHGGKGCNQSVALARAGANVMHVGKIGADGAWIRQRLADCGADVSLITTCDAPTGHAVIQVSSAGENSIIIHGGANQQLDDVDVESGLKNCGPEDFVLTQNETSSVECLLRSASDRGLFVIFNPAPMTEAVKDYLLDGVSLFIVNETEGQGLVGARAVEKIIEGMRLRFPSAKLLLTLGERGAVYCDQNLEIHVPAEKVVAVDTTSAGDTFIGYFLAGLAKQLDPETCLRYASRAASLCVQRHGAAYSIPTRFELEC